MFGIPSHVLDFKKPLAMYRWYRSRLSIRKAQRTPITTMRPVIAQVEPTVRCDLDCTFCQSRELRRSRDKANMSLEQFKHVIDELHFLVEVGIIGMGEPTLHPDFFRMVEYADARNISPTTVTNCNRHTPEITQQLVSTGLRKIAVSVDGADAAPYEKTRRGGSFQRTIDNLGKLVEARRGAKTPEISVQMVSLDDNYHSIPELVKLCARLGVDDLMIQGRLTDWGKDSFLVKTVARGGSGRGENYSDCLEEARQLADSLGLEFDDHRNTYSKSNKCPKPWREIYVSTTGDVVPCCTIADPRVKCLGNLFEESFSDIWNGQRYVEFREALISDNIPRCCQTCYEHEALRERSIAISSESGHTLPVLTEPAGSTGAGV